MKQRAIRHPTDTTLELFASGRLGDRAVRRVEIHLLVCGACRARMAVEDSIRQMFRVGMAQPEWMEADPAEAAIQALWRVKADAETVVAAFPAIVPKVFHFRTHLPVYSLAAAAGAFGEQQVDISPQGWVAVPPGPVLVTPDMFVTHVSGRSMEPVIPDGSLCAFRSQVAQPLEGKTVLIEDYSKAGGNRYLVKRYHASRNVDPHNVGEPAWLHERITHKPTKHAYRALEIPSGRKINVIGEFAFVVSQR
jgi:hypothetical protein